MELHFPEVITYIGLCRSADTGSRDAETAYYSQKSRAVNSRRKIWA